MSVYGWWKEEVTRCVEQEEVNRCSKKEVPPWNRLHEEPPWKMSHEEQPLRTVADSNAVKVSHLEKLGGGGFLDRLREAMGDTQFQKLMRSLHFPEQDMEMQKCLGRLDRALEMLLDARRVGLGARATKIAFRPAFRAGVGLAQP